MANKICFVTTTVNKGDFLDYYARKIKKENLNNDVLMIVIPDLKTPPILYKKCKEIKKQGIKIVCPTIKEQESFLKKLGEISKIIPYNSDNRRNVGYLLALEKGGEVIISIDDDNYPLQFKPFFKEHLIVLKEKVKMPAIHSKNGWFNICNLLNAKPKNIYPRGFPYRYRFQNPKIYYKKEKGRIHINVGLWLRDPDIDAVTWLANPAKIDNFKGKSVLLGKNTWSPINTQNTALYRDAIAAYYFWRMGYPIGGMMIDRDGDIFSGYFCQACVKHLNYKIRVGTPIVNHIRNTHNYLKDLTKELGCILLLEDIVEWLRQVKLEGKNYLDAYLSLASLLDDAVEKFSGSIWNKESRNYFHYIAYCMRTWIKTIKIIS
jgi:hypothetical protein